MIELSELKDAFVLTTALYFFGLSMYYYFKKIINKGVGCYEFKEKTSLWICVLVQMCC